jgi:hypothetical protein
LAEEHLDDNPGGAGRDALAGYDYQMDMSVWLSLLLVVANKQAQELILEPASQEDIEGTLDEFEPGRVTGEVRLGQSKLVVQAKLRSGNAWTIKTLQTLLEYGGKKRIPATERLKDPQVHYLLVTSAGLNGEAASLRVKKPGRWPKPADLPSSFTEALPADAIGRIGVFSNKEPEQLEADIRLLLMDAFRVPNAQWKACLKELREEARIRIRGAAQGRWRREDLEEVIKKHGGYLASTPELELYVKPKNWDELRQAMRERHGAVIIGPSGTGKTLATRMLYQELRDEMPNLERKPIRLGPGELEDDQTPSPVLYDIEDPWGRFDFDPKSRAWNDQFDRFLSRSTANRMIVATTRRDVAEQAKGVDTVTPWLVPLEPEHYGANERQKIFELRVPGLPWDLQDPIGRSRRLVLKQLETPLEIQKFFDAVPTIDREKFRSGNGLVEEAIRLAHRNSIEQTVIEQIQERHDIRAASVIWALLKVADKFSISRVAEIEEALADEDSDWDRGIMPLVRFFVASRNLKQTDEIVTYYHPRVEAGILQALKNDRLAAGKALRALIGYWLSLEDGGAWGAKASAKLIAGIPKDSKINLKLPTTAIQAIDSWLETNLSDPPDKLERALDLIAEAGSPSSSQAEIARYLLASAMRRGVFLDSWENPKHTDEWYSSRRADPTTKPLIERFIRKVLPWSHSHYTESFARDLLRLAPDLSQAFLDAALEIVHRGVTHNDDPIAEGALEDLAGYENVVNEAVKARELTTEENAKADELHLRLINGEFSEEYAEHLATSDEDGYTAGELLKAYVRRLHKTGNWKQIASHAHRDSMSWFWLTVFRDDLNRSNFLDEEESAPALEIKIDQDELAALFELAFNSRHEDDLWQLVGLVWDGRFLAPLLERMKQGSDSEKVRVAALRCLLLFAPNEFEAICEDLKTGAKNNRLVEIALDLAHLENHVSALSRRHKEPEPDAAAAMRQLPPAATELGLAFAELLHDRKPTIGEQAQHFLFSIYNASEDMRRLRLVLSKASDATWQEDVDALLTSATEPDIAAEAVQAAALEKQAAVLEQALTHKFATVRATALRAIAEELAAPLPARLLKMASDKGQYVRRILGELLAQKVHPAHWAALMTLVRDNYSTGSHYADDHAQFPIARAAVKTMKEYPVLSRESADELLEIAISSGDPTLRCNVFDTLAVHAGPDGQEMLFQLATEPGRYIIRGQAAAGLLSAFGSADPELVAKITPDLLTSQPSNVAASLTLLLGAGGEIEAIESAATALAANTKRRVLVLLLIHVVNGRIPEFAPKLAALMPTDHPALVWALGGEIDWENDKPLSDLGERSICGEVFVFMKPSAPEAC